MILKVFIAKQNGENVVKFSIGLQTFTIDYKGTDDELTHYAELLLHALKNITHIQDEKWVEANPDHRQYVGTIKIIAKLESK